MEDFNETFAVMYIRDDQYYPVALSEEQLIMIIQDNTEFKEKQRI